MNRNNNNPEIHSGYIERWTWICKLSFTTVRYFTLNKIVCYSKRNLQLSSRFESDTIQNNNSLLALHSELSKQFFHRENWKTNGWRTAISKRLTTSHSYAGAGSRTLKWKMKSHSVLIKSCWEKHGEKPQSASFTFTTRGLRRVRL